MPACPATTRSQGLCRHDRLRRVCANPCRRAPSACSACALIAPTSSTNVQDRSRDCARIRGIRRYSEAIMDHAGGCHCGNIHVRLRLSETPERTPVRTCTCSFCRSHNPRMISDPAGLLELSADDWSLVELYRFGTRTADFVICRRCGVFIAAVSDLSTQPQAVVNMNCLDDR